MKAEVPLNCTAEIRVPGKEEGEGEVVKVGSGSYEFEVDWEGKE